MNPVIKFITLVGLLAVELAVEMTKAGQGTLTRLLSVVFLLVAMFFVYRSFFGMRVGTAETDAHSH
jgi:K(+)-stimulated pyrophosphate-energized sodium pump